MERFRGKLLARLKRTRPDLLQGNTANAVAFGDRERLGQCISNLLVNAVKYTNPGGEIRVRHYSQGGQVVIEIADSGVGISPELLPHIFELFVQGDRTLDRSQGGLGVGLAICKQLIEMHRGTVTANSDGVGRGATFEIRLPLTEATTEIKYCLRTLPLGNSESV